MARVNIIRHLSENYTSKERGEILKESDLDAASLFYIRGLLEKQLGSKSIKIIDIDVHITMPGKD